MGVLLWLSTFGLVTLIGARQDYRYQKYFEDPNQFPDQFREAPHHEQRHEQRFLLRRSTPAPLESWTGKWFPKPPPGLPAALHDKDHGVKMGIPSIDCDDGKTKLEVDWNDSPINYTCYTPTHPYAPDSTKKPLLLCDNVPQKYMPKHKCMHEAIKYNETIPTHGDHRPLWPKFGEYKFVPIQRWQHNIEHGAVVMIYHPCAHPQEVNKLRKLVRGCIRKHVITPYTLLEPERPLALVAWGCRLLMSEVDSSEVHDFIVKYSLKGPEGKYSKEGQYDHELIELAVPPAGSNIDDSHLCPNLHM